MHLLFTRPTTTTSSSIFATENGIFPVKSMVLARTNPPRNGWVHRRLLPSLVLVAVFLFLVSFLVGVVRWPSGPGHAWQDPLQILLLRGNEST